MRSAGAAEGGGGAGGWGWGRNIKTPALSNSYLIFVKQHQNARRHPPRSSQPFARLLHRRRSTGAAELLPFAINYRCLGLRDETRLVLGLNTADAWTSRLQVGRVGKTWITRGQIDHRLRYAARPTSPLRYVPHRHATEGQRPYQHADFSRSRGTKVISLMATSSLSTLQSGHLDSRTSDLLPR